MISLGGSSTYLQNQVISGFDSVAQGFTAAATTTGATALQTAQDSFSSFDSTETTALASMGSQQTISGTAEFSSPTAYMQSQGIQANEPVLRAFQDPSLASGGDLSGISEILSQVTSDAQQRGIIIVSGSPTQLQQRASTKLEQAGLITPPQIGGSTKFEQAGVFAPPQFGGSSSDLLAQAGAIGPPIRDQFTKAAVSGPPISDPLVIAGLNGPPIKDLLTMAGIQGPPISDPLLKAGANGPPIRDQFSIAGITGPPISDPLIAGQSGPPIAPQFGAFDAISFSPQQTTALASMSKTVREAASLFQNVNVSMLGRRIVG